MIGVRDKELRERNKDIGPGGGTKKQGKGHSWRLAASPVIKA